MCFPLLPSYQAFNAGLNNLWEAFGILMTDFMNRATLHTDGLKVVLGDSLPVMTCWHKRNGRIGSPAQFA